MPAALNYIDAQPTARLSRPTSPARLLWPLVILIGAPLALLPERFPLPAVALGLLLMLVPFVVRWAVRGSPTVMRPAMWPLLFLLLVSLPITARVSPFFMEITWPELVRVVWGIGLFFAVANWSEDVSLDERASDRDAVPRPLALATTAFVAVGLVFSAVGLFALQASNKVPLLTDLVQQIPALTSGPLGLAGGFNANRVAGLVVLFVPLCALLCLAPAGHDAHPGLRAAHWLGRAALLIALLFFAGLLVLTQSRTALLAAAFATPVALLIAGPRGWVGLILGGVLMAAVFSVFGPRQMIQELIVRGQDAGETTVAQQVVADRNVAGRLIIWQRALAGIREQPLTGMGLAVFQRRALEPYPSPGWEPDPDITHAHNLLLQTGLDLGLPGLLAFVLFLVLVAADVGMLIHSTERNSPMRLWSAAVCGSFVAFVIYNLTDAMTLGARPAFSYWYMLGLIIGAAAWIRRRDLTAS